MAMAHLDNFTFATDMLYCNCSINAIVRQFRKELIMETAQEIHTRLVQIRVNEMPVTVARQGTGLQIKEAAIPPHLPIPLDFVLNHEPRNGNTKIALARDWT